MTEQQTHLQNLINQQNELIQMIQSLNNEVGAKRELALKVQGAIEYLQQIGITLPETESEPETETQPVE